jgi:hypothetical protein
LMGESLDSTFKGAVEVQSFAFSVENATAIGRSCLAETVPSDGRGFALSRYDA